MGCVDEWTAAGVDSLDDRRQLGRGPSVEAELEMEHIEVVPGDPVRMEHHWWPPRLFRGAVRALGIGIWQPDDTVVVLGGDVPYVDVGRRDRRHSEPGRCWIGDRLRKASSEDGATHRHSVPRG
jgi:hypothetical protein